MDKTSKILSYVWMSLAAASLISSFFLPNIFLQLINWCFGLLNVLAGIGLHKLLKNDKEEATNV